MLIRRTYFSSLYYHIYIYLNICLFISDYGSQSSIKDILSLTYFQTKLIFTLNPYSPVSAGERDAEDEGLQRRSHVIADHRAVHGRPQTGAVEATGDHHD